MKNFNGLYVKNIEEKRIKAKKEHEMLVKRLPNDQHKIIDTTSTEEDF